MTGRQAADVLLLVQYLDREWMADSAKFALARLRTDAEQVVDESTERRPMCRASGWSELVAG